MRQGSTGTCRERKLQFSLLLIYLLILIQVMIIDTSPHQDLKLLQTDSITTSFQNCISNSINKISSFQQSSPNSTTSNKLFAEVSDHTVQFDELFLHSNKIDLTSQFSFTLVEEVDDIIEEDPYKDLANINFVPNQLYYEEIDDFVPSPTPTKEHPSEHVDKADIVFHSSHIDPSPTPEVIAEQIIEEVEVAHAGSTSEEIVTDIETPIVDVAMFEEEVVLEELTAEEPVSEIVTEVAHVSHPVNWNGGVLTARKGVNQGPSGKETYYNLPMDGIVNMMHNLGYEGEYWVREDGAKMLGEYVIVAANLSVHPRGSIVETSLGMGIVADTGGFARKNPTQLDIATNW